MLLFQETQKSVRQLLEESREYAVLQRRYMQLELSERLTALLSAIAVTAVVVLVCMAVFLFLAFSLAYALGDLLNNLPLGFVIVSVILAIVLGFIYLFRYRLIVLPITRLVTRTIGDPNETKTKEELLVDIADSKSRMTAHAQGIASNTSEPLSRVEAFSQWMSRGMAVYHGIRIGVSVMNVVQSLFGRKRKKNK